MDTLFGRCARALHQPKVPLWSPSLCPVCCSAFCFLPYLLLCCLTLPWSAACHTQAVCATATAIHLVPPMLGVSGLGIWGPLAFVQTSLFPCELQNETGMVLSHGKNLDGVQSIKGSQTAHLVCTNTEISTKFGSSRHFFPSNMMGGKRCSLLAS